MTEQSNSLATTEQKAAVQDDSAYTKAARELAKRLKYMIVNGNKLADQEVFALAHYAASTDLNPFAQECYYLPGTGPVPGVVGLRRKAQEALNAETNAARVPMGYFWIETRPALPGEGNFDAIKDIAIHVTLHDSTVNKRWRTAYFETARELKELGEKDYLAAAKTFVGPEPVWTGVGVVAGSEAFSRDGKPEKFDRYERAAKRGEKLALKKRFPSLQQYEPATGAGAYDEDTIDSTFVETPSNEPKRPEAEIMKELGFAADPTPAGPEITPNQDGSIPEDLDPMFEAYQKAYDVLTSDKPPVRYGEIDTDTLGYRRTAMQAAMAKYTDLQKVNAEKKLAAIETIIAWRAAHPQ